MIALMAVIRNGLSAPADGQPSRHLAALRTWCAVYPVLTLTYVVAGAWLARLPLALRTFCVVTIVVPIVSYAVQPLLTALLARR